MAIITPQKLSEIRKKHERETIVFCSGSFDLPHAGHILFFEDCKKLGHVLVVAIGCDAIIKINKGEKRPILNEHVRLKTIDSLKPVDYCYLDTVSYEKNDPLAFMREAFENLRPDMYVINDDAFEPKKRVELSQQYHVKLVTLKRSCPEEFEKISTSGIIHKIKNL